MTTMPAAFFGHGTPMNALDSNRYTESWRAFGADPVKPTWVGIDSPRGAPARSSIPADETNI